MHNKKQFYISEHTFELGYNHYRLFFNLKNTVSALLKEEKAEVEEMWIDDKGFARYKKDYVSI